MEKKPKGRKIFHIIIDVLVILVLIVSATVLVSTLTSRAAGGIPNLFGKAPIGVKTNSMHGDNPDSFDEGDLIFCDVVSSPKEDDFKVGDVVTFIQDLSGQGEKSQVTHRIYKVNEDGTFQTKGDNNDTYDQDPHNSITFPDLHYYDILATYHGTRIPKVGYAVNFIQTPVGFFWCVLFPMILFFLYQAIRVIMNAMAYSREKGVEQAKLAVEGSGLTEEQKEKAIAEYLATHNLKESDDSGDVIPETPKEQEAQSGESTLDESDNTAEKTSSIES